MLEFIFGLFKFSLNLGTIALAIGIGWYLYVFTVWLFAEGLNHVLNFIHKLTGW